MDEVILVKGYKKNGTWSFPRGKINKDEDDLECAIREAWEETGYDIRAAGLVKDPRKIRSIEKTMRSQNMKMFVFRGVSQQAHFEPQTRKEISKIEWFRLVDLPTERRKAQTEGTGQHLVLNANKFYVVAPFMHDLKRIITAERKKDRQTSRLAAVPTTINDPVFEPLPQMPHVAPQILSPAIPSSLPEVALNTDPLLHLKQQLNISPQVSAPPVDTTAKSNALLNLLRGVPTSEMPNEPRTPFEQASLSRAPRSPAHLAHAPIMPDIQSPPPAFDLHQQMHPAAPPSSALPQLSHHTRSLLDAFRSPSLSQHQQLQSSLPLSRENLLAATSAKPSPVPAWLETPPVHPAENLLNLLQRPSTNNLTAPSPAAPKVKSGSPLPSADVPLRAVSTAQHLQPSLPSADPLLDLFRSVQPATNSAPQQATKRPVSYAAAARSAPSPAPIRPDGHAPVELSAATDQELTKPEGPESKGDLLSLFKVKKSREISHATPKSRKGTTSATLDRPIDEPQYDAIPRTSPYQDDVRRTPAAAEQKLFDHKTGDIKHVPPTIQVLSRQDERKSQPRSPHHPRQKQTNSPRRPLTPKEALKPFQPTQILQRPQTRDSDDTVALTSLMTSDMANTRKTSEVLTQGPLSPSLDAPEAVEPPVPFVHPDSIRRPSTILSPVHDPQKLELLSFLQPPKPVDLDATPKASALPFISEKRSDIVVSPTSIDQLISPVAEADLSSGPRSRVSSLASGANIAVAGRPHIEKRQTAAEDKAFLMQYLKGFASQVNS